MMKEHVTDKAFEAIRKVDPLKFCPDPSTASPVLQENLTDCLTLTRFIWSIIPVSILCMLFAIVFDNEYLLIGIPLALVSLAAILSFLFFSENPLSRSGYFSCSFLPLHEQLVDLRIINFELKTGGIYQLVDFLDTSNLDACMLKSYLDVIQQSQNKSEITDREIYYSLLLNMKESIQKTEADVIRKQIITSLQKVN